MTIDTRFMDAMNWAAQTTTLICPYGTIPKLIDEEHWRDWAALVSSLPTLAALGAVRPEPFHSWQGWAEQFNQTLHLLGL